MEFYVPLENGKEVKMRVVLPSWLGNSGCWDILSLLHFNIFTGLFFNGPIYPRLIIALEYLPEILQHSQTRGCSIVTLRPRKFL